MSQHRTFSAPGRRLACSALLAAAMTFVAPAARAAQCSVSAQGVTFGAYDPFSSLALESVGNVAVTCDVDTTYSIALSAGSAASAIPMRRMTSGANSLDYNLYTDPAYTSVWGDGSGGTAVVNGSGTSRNYPAYGRIPAGQNAHVGSYGDTLVVTLTF